MFSLGHLSLWQLLLLFLLLATATTLTPFSVCQFYLGIAFSVSALASCDGTLASPKGVSLRAGSISVRRLYPLLSPSPLGFQSPDLTLSYIRLEHTLSETDMYLLIFMG